MVQVSECVSVYVLYVVNILYKRISYVKRGRGKQKFVTDLSVLPGNNTQ